MARLAPESRFMSIEVRQIVKTFDKHVALKNVDLKVEAGEMVALLGPSGSGKTTLLRVIAGLEPADSGQVLFHGEDVRDQRVGDRRVGFVFQHYALFRHMSVFENVAFGLRCRPWKLRPRKAEIREKVTELLRLVQLENFARRLPTQLSGGQRQRVALARALAIEPRVLLLDEPFGALDAQVRRELRGWIRRLHDRLGFTSIFVTHDQEEALEIADRIVVMRAGAIEQVGTPDEVYEHPATSFVFQFLGDVNLFHGRLNSAAQYVRPHDVHVSRENSPDSIPAKVARVRRAGAVVHVDLLSQPDDKPVIATLARDRFAELALMPGEHVRLQLSDVRVYEQEYSI
jgi:sulfate transport system ATP-binding protein